MSPSECFLHSWWSIQRAKSYSVKKNTDLDIWHFLHKDWHPLCFCEVNYCFLSEEFPPGLLSVKESHAITVGEKKAKPFTLPGLNPSAPPQGQQQPQPLPFPNPLPPPSPSLSQAFLSMDDLVSVSQRNCSCLWEEHNSTSCPLSDKFEALVSCFPLSSKS